MSDDILFSNKLNEQLTACLRYKPLLKAELWFWVTKGLKKSKIKKVVHLLFFIYSYSPCFFFTFYNFYLVHDVHIIFWVCTQRRTLLTFSVLIQIWIELYMDGCPFRFAFKYGFNSPAKVLAQQWKVIYHLLPTV